jgi:hypothetical protein
MCLPNNHLGKKFLNKKSYQPNKALVPDPKQNQWGWLENTSSIEQNWTPLFDPKLKQNKQLN